MGFFKDLGEKTGLGGGGIGGILGGAAGFMVGGPAGAAIGAGLGSSILGGQDAQDAAREAAQIQAQTAQEQSLLHQQAGQEAAGYLQPYAGIGQQGLDQIGFLTNPQQQYDYLQGNPLFQAALNAANQQTQSAAAARGRLSSTDTQQQLAQNVLLAGQPLINQQQNAIQNLINAGIGVAGGQGNLTIGTASDVSNLMTSGAASQAAGIVGAANAQQQGINNMLNLGMMGAMMYGGSPTVPIPGGGNAMPGINPLQYAP